LIEGGSTRKKKGAPDLRDATKERKSKKTKF